ncbi:MAG: N-6 DNA methylase [Cytophagales bacterium]|nr:N-6 DNA methylase [Cytophagales bacterium]
MTKKEDIEVVLNPLIADYLSKRLYKVEREQTVAGYGAKRIDLTIKVQGDDDDIIGVECKRVNGNLTQVWTDLRRQIQERGNMLSHFIGVIYLNDFKSAKDADLEIGLPDEKGELSFYPGDVDLLCKLIRAVHVQNVETRLTKTLKDAIDRSVAKLTEDQKIYIKDRMRKEGEKEKLKIDDAARIGMLILANAYLFYELIRENGNKFEDEEHKKIAKIVPSLSSLLRESDPKEKTIDAWDLVLQIDYKAIFKEARDLLLGIPTSNIKTALRVLIEKALDIKGDLKSTQNDLSGRIYHAILESAQNEGTYYTTSPAARILAELALPKDFIDWSDLNAIAKLKIMDPACGTGTLLAACKQVCVDRYRDACIEKGIPEDANTIDTLRLFLIEDVLHGLDINLSAIHLTASMLASADPHIAFNKMNVHRARLGDEKGKVFIGSPSLLDSGQLAFYENPHMTEQVEGRNEEEVDYRNGVDLIIMNPPFTRGDLRYKHLEDDVSKSVLKEERKWMKAHGNGYKLSSSESSHFFHPLSHGLGKEEGGRLAMILPFSMLIASKGLATRKYLADHWHIEQVITSHDPKRIFFSFETKINECLVIARRKREGEVTPPTYFTNLYKNPKTDAEAVCFHLNPGKWGQTTPWSAEHMGKGIWTPAAFYSPNLSEAILNLSKESGLTPLEKIVKVLNYWGVDKSSTKKGRLRLVEVPQDRKALRYHKEHLNTMLGKPDSYIQLERGQEDKAKAYFQQNSARLLLSHQWFPKTQAIAAVYMEEAVMAGNWHPAQVKQSQNQKEIERALCAWFNSTLGVLTLFSVGSHKIPYPALKTVPLRGLPVPDVRDASVRKPLAAVQKAYEKSPLKVLKDAQTDEVRKALDDAVKKALNLDWDIDKIRKTLSEEPRVQ